MIRTEGEMLKLRVLYPEVTPRHLNNIVYRSRAVSVLAHDPEFAWLADGPAMTEGKRNSWKPGILAELGRIDNEDDIRTFAREICRIKPFTKDAERAIREWRLGKEPKVKRRKGKELR